MFKRTSMWAVALTLALASTRGFAADAPATAPDKNEQGLTATLINNKDGSYTLDAAQSGKEFRTRMGLLKGAAPKPPAVDLTLRITNTTDKDLTITIGGDSSHLDIKLEGEGALTLDNRVMMDRMFRIGQPATIPAGKSYDMAISSLAFGARGISKYAYFTEAGEYTLSAALVYAEGEKQFTVSSAAIKLKVEAPKP